MIINRLEHKIINSISQDENGFLSDEYIVEDSNISIISRIRNNDIYITKTTIELKEEDSIRVRNILDKLSEEIDDYEYESPLFALIESKAYSDEKVLEYGNNSKITKSIVNIMDILRENYDEELKKHFETIEKVCNGDIDGLTNVEIEPEEKTR